MQVVEAIYSCVNKCLYINDGCEIKLVNYTTTYQLCHHIRADVISSWAVQRGIFLIYIFSNLWYIMYGIEKIVLKQHKAWGATKILGLSAKKLAPLYHKFKV